MAAPKAPKAELIAIYRLEFYKKQEHWKLSEDTRKKKEAQKCLTNSKVLNETYSIESNVDDGQCALNDAFLVDEPGKGAPTSTTTLCTQQLEPISACQECQRINKPQIPWADYVNGVLQQKDVGACDYGNVDKWSDDNEFEGFNPAHIGDMVWTNSGYLPTTPQNWIEDMRAQVDMIQETMCPMDWATDNVEQLTHFPDDHMWEPEMAGDNFLMQSLEDVEEFLIGVHSAPHSSEIELCLPDEGDTQLNVSQCSVSRMSAAELARAARRHALSLSALLRESRRRRLRSTLSLDMCAANNFELTPRDVFSTDFSCEAFPTRDTGFDPLQPLGGVSYTPGLDEMQCNLPNRQILDPYQLTTRLEGPVGIESSRQALDTVEGTQMNLRFYDGFVAGSFRNSLQVDVVGRGRGRLPSDAVGVGLAKPGGI